MFTITMIVYSHEERRNVETRENRTSEDTARARFRELRRREEYDYLRLSDGENKTLARWHYGEEDQAHEAFMTRANTVEAERPFGPDAHKMPIIKDRE